MKSNAQGAEFWGVTGLWKSTLAEWEWAMGKHQGTQQENLLPATGSYMLSGGGKKRRGVEVPTTTVFWLWFCSEKLIVEPEGLWRGFQAQSTVPRTRTLCVAWTIIYREESEPWTLRKAKVLRLLPVSSLPNFFFCLKCSVSQLPASWALGVFTESLDGFNCFSEAHRLIMTDSSPLPFRLFCLSRIHTKSCC